MKDKELIKKALVWSTRLIPIGTFESITIDFACVIKDEGIPSFDTEQFVKDCMEAREDLPVNETAEYEEGD